MNLDASMGALTLDELVGYLGAAFGLWLVGVVASMIVVWLRLRRTPTWTANRGWRRRMNALERLAIRSDRLVLGFSFGLVLALAVGEIVR